ncbi:hypothetical protein AVEN_76738-1 [Araneus ventricosus]|uniref:Uncharacterized protein n=1 Tax=Araneus ventricosus TaxID=182803 RepID=A0A4Y1ZTB3_ARAVE|nr:hypothetical protein AVEN_76738-1 [Araneus ventricosus]
MSECLRNVYQFVVQRYGCDCISQYASSQVKSKSVFTGRYREGTNNSSELLSSIVSKFNRLFDTIRNLNPKIKLLISGLVPRGPNRFSYGFVSAAYGTFLSSLNIKIEAINAELEQLADLQGFYFFRRNPTNWKGCLVETVCI